MSDHSSPRYLAKYLATARQHLSQEKVLEFQAAYLRMQKRADSWNELKPAPIEPASPRPNDKPTG